MCVYLSLLKSVPRMWGQHIVVQERMSKNWAWAPMRISTTEWTFADSLWQTREEKPGCPSICIAGVKYSTPPNSACSSFSPYCHFLRAPYAIALHWASENERTMLNMNRELVLKESRIPIHAYQMKPITPCLFSIALSLHFIYLFGGNRSWVLYCWATAPAFLKILNLETWSH